MPMVGTFATDFVIQHTYIVNYRHINSQHQGMEVNFRPLTVCLLKQSGLLQAIFVWYQVGYYDTLGMSK